MGTSKEMREVKGVKVAKTIPLKGLKKMMAERLLKSHLTAAEVPVVMREIDVTEFIKLRDEVFKKSPEFEKIKISFNHLLIKATGYALKQQPWLNSAIVEDKIVIFDEFNIGFAVALEGAALVVPVIHHADRKTVWQIAEEGATLTQKARSGKLRLEDVSGGTFTITNAGMLGVDVGCGIINMPQSAILTTGRFNQKVAFRDGNIVPRYFMAATISYDHRILSGEPVGLFLQALARVLEKPGEYAW